MTKPGPHSAYKERKSDDLENGTARGWVEIGREVINHEIEGLVKLRHRVGEDFERAVGLLLNCRGKVVVCGIGKSGIVARKIAATLSSTGTPSVYLHPVEATHGDMGMITEDDILLAVSKSGGNKELTDLMKYLSEMEVKIISITSKAGSHLAENSDIALVTAIEREACPMDMVPTTSTTAAMVLGDALAVAIFRNRDFDREDFARLHPAGVLGKKLLLTVDTLMHHGEEMPIVRETTKLRDALFEIANKRLGCVGVTDSGGKLVGIVTDGDLKRILIKDPSALESKVSELMTPHPRTIRGNRLAIEALEQMEIGDPSPITQLFVIDSDGVPKGLIHIHDIIRAGLK